MSQRPNLNLDEDIDLEELTKHKSKPKPTTHQMKKIESESQKTGFTSREPKKRRRVSPYTEQFGGKCRPGMKAIFQQMGERMQCYDTHTLELAILALIEKQGYDDLKHHYDDVTK